MASVIAATIQLRDQFSATLNKINKNLGAFQRQTAYVGKNISKTGKDMAKTGTSLTKSITVPVIAMGTAAVVAATNFTHEMADIRKEVLATAGTTANANKIMSQMSSSSIKWSEDFGQSTDDINASLLTLVKDGYSGSEAMDIMNTSLNTARGSDENLTDVVNTLGTSLEAYGLKTNNATKTTANMTKMADTFAYIANHTKASITSLGEAFSIVGPTASALKIPLQQTAAAIGELQSNGIDATTAATSLKAGLVNLTKPTAKMSKAMKDMGLDAFDANGNMKDLPTILKDIEKGTKGFTNQQKEADLATTFGKESLATWNVLLTKGSGNLSKLSKDANNAKGETKKLSDAMANTAKNNFTKLTESVHALGVTFGKDILPDLMPIVAKVTGLVNAFANLDEPTKKAIIKFAFLAATVGPVILVVGKLTKKIGDTVSYFTHLSKNISDAGGVLKWFCSPGHLVVLAILALIAVAVIIVLNWGKITKAFKDNYSTIKTVGVLLACIFIPILVYLGVQALISAAAMLAITWPVYAVIAVLVLLGLGIYEIIKHWADLKAGGAKAWKSITNTVQNACADIGIGQHTVDTSADNTGSHIKALDASSAKSVKSMDTNISNACGNSALSLNKLGAKCPPTSTNFSTLNTDTTSSVNTMQQNIDAACGKSKTSLINLGNTGKPTSKALNDGLVNGMNTNNSVVKASDDLVTKIKASFTSKTGFDIHSPSKWATTMAGQIGTGFINGMSAKNITSFMSRLVSKIKNGASGVFSAVTNMGGNVSSWLTQALIATGTPSSWMQGMLTLIQAESGGNPGSYNGTSVLGQHATGIAQMLPETFGAHMVAGHGNISNPIDNLMSSINYIKSEYGSVYGIKNLGTSAYKGYAVGSRYVPADVVTTVHKGEMITPANENMYKNSKGKILPSTNGGIVVNVIVQGNMIGNETFADYVAAHIVKKLNFIEPNLA